MAARRRSGRLISVSARQCLIPSTARKSSIPGTRVMAILPPDNSTCIPDASAGVKTSEMIHLIRQKAKALLAEAELSRRFPRPDNPYLHHCRRAGLSFCCSWVTGRLSACRLNWKLSTRQYIPPISSITLSVELQAGDENVGWMFDWTFQSFFNCTYHSANMYTTHGVHSTGNDPTARCYVLKAANETDPTKAAANFQ